MGPFEEYWKRLVRVCIDRQLTLVPLGKTGRQVIWMVKNDKANTTQHKLIVAGTHGEEIAGPWGILKFLEEADDYILFLSYLSIIPVVSPVVFGKRRQRTIKPNCGFVPGMFDRLSAEAGVLMSHLPRLVRASEDGLLNLHETAEESHFYLYLMGEDWTAAEHLLIAGRQYFKIISHGEPMHEPKSPRARAWNGIVHDCLDGSLDHRLWLDGSSPCITTETPGRKPLTKRIKCTVDLIKAFIELRR